MVFLVDTREKFTLEFEDRMKALGKYESIKLNCGDYSFKYTNELGKEISCGKDIAIERKMNLVELAANFTHGRERFEREMQRAKDARTKIVLLVEYGCIDDIIEHKYNSQYNPSGFMASLLSWKWRYNIDFVFCKAEYTGEMIRKILHYWLKEKLKREEE